MVTGNNHKREAARIALAKEMRAYEIMRCFKNCSVKPSNTKKL